MVAKKVGDNRECYRAGRIFGKSVEGTSQSPLAGNEKPPGALCRPAVRV